MRIKIITVLLTLFSLQLAAQHSYIPSERTFTTKDGLSSDKIHVLHKDNQGFIWIGTENGVDRFDGQSFQNFSKAAYPGMTISRVQNIVEDEKGYLWFIKENEPFEHKYASLAIDLYNIHTGEWASLEKRFRDNLPFKLEEIDFISQLSDGSIFIYNQDLQTAFLYQNKDVFKKISFPERISNISECTLHENGNLLLEGFSEKGEINDRYIFSISQTGKLLKKVKANFPIQIQSSTQSYDLVLRGNYYLSGGKNLEAYQLYNPNFQNNQTASATSKPIDHTAWNKDQELLWIKNSSNIFVTSFNGDIVYQKEEKFDNSAIPILFDGTTTWYSNKQNGLVALNLRPNHFQTYQYSSEEFRNSARGIYATTSGEIWHSNIAGILHRPTSKDKLQFLGETPIFTNFIKSRNGHLWFTKNDRFVKYNFDTKQEEYYPIEPSLDITYWSLYEANDGQIWLFGNQGLHHALDPISKKIETIHQHPALLEDNFNVYDVQKRDAQSIWLCTNQGLYILDNQGNYIAHYNEHQEGEYYLPATDIHHMYQDKNGTIWLATGGAGLLQLKINNEQLTIESHFTTQNGLYNDILHAIYEDDFGYLWISSNEGLMQFDKQTEKIVTYTVEDGLLHNEFNRISHFQAEDGMLYFGGVTGMISFHPKHFSQVRYEGSQAPLVITDFQQYSGKKRLFESRTHQLNQTNTIRLRPNDRFFNLTLSMLNYRNNATFQYRIKGLYDWQTVKGNDLNISGLPYGKHTLEIKAQNDKQQEASNQLTYTIIVMRPFYLKWWFLLLVLGALGTGAFYFIRWRTQQMLVFQETEQLRQLDTMKSQFFANISHELRTPITLILAPLGQLIKNFREQSPDKVEDQLKKIQYNGKNLLSLVNEVLDLSKLEANKLELNVEPTRIPQFIERIIANFESAAKVKGIEYQFVTFLQKKIIAEFDQAKLEKILNNLLSNALKFTPKNGTIQIIVGQINDDLVIKVKDSGKGISEEDLPNIFDRYFQAKQEEMSGGTGIGLALTKELVELMDGQISVQSEVGQGTEFAVQLPVTSCELPVASSDEPNLVVPIAIPLLHSLSFLCQAQYV